MIISARIVYNIPDELVRDYFPDTPIEDLTPDDILNNIFEDYPDWEDEFADYWSDWEIGE